MFCRHLRYADIVIANGILLCAVQVDLAFNITSPTQQFRAARLEADSVHSVTYVGIGWDVVNGVGRKIRAPVTPNLNGAKRGVATSFGLFRGGIGCEASN